MMTRRARPPLTLLAGLLLLGAAACGDEQGTLYGSQCDLISCEVDRTDCLGYFGGAATPSNIQVTYWRGSDKNGWEYTAKLVFIDLDQLDPPPELPGHRFEEQELLDHVQFTRPPPGENWPAFEGTYCEIQKGGNAPNSSFGGKCGFIFDNGRTLTAKWSCTMEEEPQ